MAAERFNHLHPQNPHRSNAHPLHTIASHHTSCPKPTAHTVPIHTMSLLIPTFTTPFFIHISIWMSPSLLHRSLSFSCSGYTLTLKRCHCFLGRWISLRGWRKMYCTVYIININRHTQIYPEAIPPSVRRWWQTLHVSAGEMWSPPSNVRHTQTLHPTPSPIWGALSLSTFHPFQVDRSAQLRTKWYITSRLRVAVPASTRPSPSSDSIPARSEYRRWRAYPPVE